MDNIDHQMESEMLQNIYIDINTIDKISCMLMKNVIQEPGTSCFVFVS